jgi:hypothetical protein
MQHKDTDFVTTDRDFLPIFANFRKLVINFAL